MPELQESDFFTLNWTPMLNSQVIPLNQKTKERLEREAAEAEAKLSGYDPDDYDLDDDEDFDLVGL